MDNSFLYTKTLLLVDNEPDLLKMLSDILKDAGFQKILMADTGKEAVAEAKKGKPDLIILDVMLPDKDGFSLMEQLRSFTDVPIIFLTAKDEAADKLAGLGLGADDYIVKPFLPQELILRIYAVLRRSYKEDNPLVVLDGCTVDFDRAEIDSMLLIQQNFAKISHTKTFWSACVSYINYNGNCTFSSVYHNGGRCFLLLR